MQGIFGKVDIENEISKEYLRIIGDAYNKPSLFIDKNIGFGMSRIICDKNIQKGFPSQNEDQSVTVVFNGEIHNYQELENDLISKKHRFSETRDVELIAHMYEEYGEDFAKKINGLFSIALWDSKKKTFYLILDLFGGIYPIYYASDKGNLLFSSKIESILKDEAIKRGIDMGGLNAYFTYGIINWFSRSSY